MNVSAAEQQQVAHAIIDRWGICDRRGKTNRWWSEFYFESGMARLESKFKMSELEEYLRLCDEAGVAKSDEFRIFRIMMNNMGRHGDDGYGDRPTNMSRVVYWFQHVDNSPAPPPANDDGMPFIFKTYYMAKTV